MPWKDQVSQSGWLVMKLQKPECYSGWAQSLGGSPDLNNIKVGYHDPAPRLIQNIKPRDRAPDREGPVLVVWFVVLLVLMCLPSHHLTSSSFQNDLVE
jgi:hypothetical protein